MSSTKGTVQFKPWVIQLAVCLRSKRRCRLSEIVSLANEGKVDPGQILDYDDSFTCCIHLIAGKIFQQTSSVPRDHDVTRLHLAAAAARLKHKIGAQPALILYIFLSQPRPFSSQKNRRDNLHVSLSNYRLDPGNQLQVIPTRFKVMENLSSKFIC